MQPLHGWRRVLAPPVLLVVGYAFYLPSGTAVYATHPPRAALGASTPADVNRPYRDVELTAPGGLMLSGWYIPSGNEAAVVLLFDPRGHGGSGGDAMEFG